MACMDMFGMHLGICYIITRLRRGWDATRLRTVARAVHTT